MKYIALLLFLTVGQIFAQEEIVPTSTTLTPPEPTVAPTPPGSLSPVITPMTPTSIVSAATPKEKKSGLVINFNSDDEDKSSNTSFSMPKKDFTGQIVPLAGIVFAFGTPLALVALVLAYRMKKRRLLHQTIEKLVASGQPIPPSLLDLSGARSVPTVHSDRRKGIILCMVGLGLIGYFLADGGSWGVGFVPLAIGAGYLLTARFAPRGETTIDGDKN